MFNLKEEHRTILDGIGCGGPPALSLLFCNGTGSVARAQILLPTTSTEPASGASRSLTLGTRWDAVTWTMSVIHVLNPFTKQLT